MCNSKNTNILNFYLKFIALLHIFCRVNLKTKYDSAYMSYGVNCTEVEIDVLTGEVEVLRSDILFDCGQRYNVVYV